MFVCLFVFFGCWCIYILVAVEPDMKVYNYILDYFRMNKSFGDRSCHVGPDERFLSEFFLGYTSNNFSLRNPPPTHRLRQRESVNGELIDWDVYSHWTHIDSDYARKSYINYTEISDNVPYFIHYCTFNPWKAPPVQTDKQNDWIYEEWEDFVIWQCCRVTIDDEFQESVPELLKLMGDTQFKIDVLKQAFSKKYMSYCQQYFVNKHKNNNKSKNNKQQTQQPQQQASEKAKAEANADAKAAEKEKEKEEVTFMEGMYNIMIQSWKDTKAAKRQTYQKAQSELKKKQNFNGNRNKNEEKIDSGLQNHGGLRGQSSSQEQRQGQEQGQRLGFKNDLLLNSLKKKINLPDKIIWQFWNDKYENIPISVQKCIDSVKVNNPNWMHILLTPENMFEYLDKEDLPENVLQFEKPAHISDCVRVAIVAHYGGIYCDASIICFPNVGNCNFDYIWDELLMKQGVKSTKNKI